ncbi:transcriptional regulator with XRE-family HTH domain [Flavobacterium sp. SORGH_AS 622]|nr:transcriptional regulator with XRE-family HTH domain [Flavobacterium sp. SORGH_AS_0622]
MIKLLRLEKKLSQSFIAHELGVEQSQYCRREKGEINFSPEEIKKIAKILETNIAVLFNEGLNYSGEISSDNILRFVTVPEKLIHEYEKIIKQKDDLIKELRQKNKGSVASSI